MEQSDTIDRLLTKASDLERHLGIEQVRSYRMLKDIRTGRKGY